MLWFTCSLGVDHFLTKKGGQTCSKETSDIQCKWKKKILIKVKWMWSYPTWHFSICAYSVCWSTVLCFFTLCLQSGCLCSFALWPWVFRFYIPTGQYQRGSREHDIGFSCGGYRELHWIHKKEKLSAVIIPEGSKDTLPSLVYISWLDQF